MSGIKSPQFSSVQFSCSVVSDSLRPHELQHARPPCPLPTSGVHSNSGPSSRWCHPAISSSVVPFSSCPQSLPASVFFNESTLRMRWPKYWSFSFSISPSKEHPGLISFRMDWLDLLAVQGTLKSLLQHQSSKASILRHSAFFVVQLSHPYMTIGKALTRWTFVGKVMSLLFTMLSRLVITFLPNIKEYKYRKGFLKHAVCYKSNCFTVRYLYLILDCMKTCGQNLGKLCQRLFCLWLQINRLLNWMAGWVFLPPKVNACRQHVCFLGWHRCHHSEYLGSLRWRQWAPEVASLKLNPTLACRVWPSQHYSRPSWQKVKEN